MDAADRRILRAIQADPELTMRQLGEAAGLSHTPCWRRLNKLRKDGIITEKRYVLNRLKLGFEIVAFCFVRMKEHTRETLNEFEEAAYRVPEVVECYSATGDHDYILKVLASTIQDYEKTIKHKLLELPHVSIINTSLTLNEVKNTPDVPL